MRKLFVLVLALLLAGGAVWAQNTPGVTAPDLTGTGALGDTDNFDLFNAVTTLSTEYRYGGGLFGSYVDDFIDVNFFNPEVGTFVFASAYPLGTTYALNAGLAKTLSFGYLGVYYGGSLLDSAGTNNGESSPTVDSHAEWSNNFALLLAFNALPGAFRLDFIQKTTVTEQLQGGTTSYLELADTTDAPSLALTWGGFQIAGLNSYVTVGYRFNDLTVRSVNDGNTFRKLETNVGGLFGLQAGAYYDLDDTSSISGALVFTMNGATTVKGDNTYTATPLDPALPNTMIDTSSGGNWGIGLRAAYAKTFEFGKLSFGFKPTVRIGFESGFTGRKDANDTWEAAAENKFQIDSGIDLGLKYQHNEKFGFYTDASLQIIDFRNWYYAGGQNYTNAHGDTRRSDSRFDMDGLVWNTGNLRVGMTFTPIENLVIGAGLNTVLDKLFYVNLATMQVGTGTWFNQATPGYGNILGEALHLFDGIEFDLTVSYKF